MDKTLVKTISVPSSRTLTANEKDSVETAIRQFARQRDVHTLFIVDADKKLKGLVKLHYILNWVKLKLGMKVTDHANMRVGGASQAFEVMRLCQSQTIGDILSPAISVKPDNTLEQAMHLMVQEQLVELPVIDEAGKLTGEIKLTDLLSRMLETAPDNEVSC